MTDSWRLQHWIGDAATLHARQFEPPLTRTVAVLEVQRPALVLGSTQPDVVVDADGAVAAGLDVARRRSGGGAVLLEPGGVTWVDVVIPRDDPLWDDDVSRSFFWLGEAWALALGPFTDVELVVHRGALVRTPWSSLVCFAGVGAGEVMGVGPDGAPDAKVVGMAQRRTRAGARFQCAVHHRWNPARLLTALALDAPRRAEASDALAGAAVEVAATGEELVNALVSQLP